MTTSTPMKRARCSQGWLIITETYVQLRARSPFTPRPRWTVSRQSVADLAPHAGHGVTFNLIIRTNDGAEHRLDWLLPHDAMRVATALGYEWSIAEMREMAALAALGDEPEFTPALRDTSTLERPTRVVVRPSAPVVVAHAQPGEPAASAHPAPSQRAAIFGAPAAAAAFARLGGARAYDRVRSIDMRPAIEALSARARAFAGDARSLRLPRLSSPRMKLLYLAVLASLLAVSSAGWLFPGQADGHSSPPQSRLVQVFGGLPPVIATTPTPTPTVAPTPLPFATPTPQPQPTPVPQPTATPGPQGTLDVVFTCATATAFVSGQICVHTQPFAVLVGNITYCTGNIVNGGSPDMASASTQGWARADANGNYTWNFVPKTRCIGPATATVTATWQGQTVTRSTTFIVKP